MDIITQQYRHQLAISGNEALIIRNALFLALNDAIARKKQNTDEKTGRNMLEGLDAIREAEIRILVQHFIELVEVGDYTKYPEDFKQ
jgi:hypothetical protein